MQKRESKIKIRNGFSERQGIYKCNTQMQVDELDDRTRTLIINHLYELLNNIFENTFFLYKGKHYLYNGSDDFCLDLLSEVFLQKTLLDRNAYYDWIKVFHNHIDEVISDAPYYEVFDLLHYICKWISKNYSSSGWDHPAVDSIYGYFNELFIKEYVGYRFINGEITPITNDIEVKAIEDALIIKHQGAKKQLQKAIAYLSDRNRPDYKNSIKESISAVESICQLIVEDEHATLGQALKQLEKHGVILHSSFKSALDKLYGYTSDEGGIRHAEGLTESEVTFAEAKYMLVSCCAFVNYLLEKYGK